MTRRRATLERTALELRRVYSASPTEVFQAFTDPSQLREWFHPPGGSSPSAEIDLRVGGQFRVAMKPPFARARGRLARDEVVYCVGTYLEVQPPHRLVYTFDWEGLYPVLCGDSVVTVEFHDTGGATELVLRHERLRRGAHRAFHSVGWRSSLRALHRVFEPGAFSRSMTSG